MNNKLCSFPGCARKYCAKGLCNTHWAQQARHGSLRPIVTEESMEDRFWRQVDKAAANGCWLWTGPDVGKNKKLGRPSYGQLYWKGSRVYAHKLSYILHFGDVEAGYEIDHNCLNPKCVNPEHLEKVTRLENSQRMHLYRNLTKEINRLRNLVKSLGGDPDADVLARSRLSEVGKVSRPF